MSKPLFTKDDEGTTAGYRNIRDAKNGPLYSARMRCEYYWKFFERHADNEFAKELRSNFEARYWEMHLTTSLILNGREVTCPKPGPDAGIVYRGQRIWFEAVSPGPGEPGHPDYIELPKPGEVSDAPNERMVLRYLNSISEKYAQSTANSLRVRRHDAAEDTASGVHARASISHTRQGLRGGGGIGISFPRQHQEDTQAKTARGRCRGDSNRRIPGWYAQRA